MGASGSAEWVAWDAAVVCHGFTQMAAYADYEPIVVERAQGRELIDVEGRRYLDAISSLWVVTLGHRVRELDDAVREQLDGVAHSTHAREREPGGHRFRLGAGPGRPRARAVPVVRLRWGGGRGAGAEDRLAALGEPRRAGPGPLPGPRWRLPRGRGRVALAGCRGFGTELFDSLRSRLRGGSTLQLRVATCRRRLVRRKAGIREWPLKAGSGTQRHARRAHLRSRAWSDEERGRVQRPLPPLLMVKQRSGRER